eukprot:326673-Amphidinium_carterae.1
MALAAKRLIFVAWQENLERQRITHIHRQRTGGAFMWVVVLVHDALHSRQFSQTHNGKRGSGQNV